MSCLLLFIGEVLAEKDRCKACAGKKLAQEKKVQEVHIDKGMVDGHKIPLRGQGDERVSGGVRQKRNHISLSPSLFSGHLFVFEVLGIVVWVYFLRLFCSLTNQNSERNNVIHQKLLLYCW